MCYLNRVSLLSNKMIIRMQQLVNYPFVSVLYSVFYKHSSFVSFYWKNSAAMRFPHLESLENKLSKKNSEQSFSVYSHWKKSAATGFPRLELQEKSQTIRSWSRTEVLPFHPPEKNSTSKNFKILEIF